VHGNLKGGDLMIHRLQFFVSLLVLGVAFSIESPSVAQFAAGIVSYNAGTTAANGFAFSAAALGSPERFTGEGSFPSVVSPFSPPFLSSEIVSVGEGGHITLRLSHYAVPLAAGPEIGVFSNIGLIDVAFPNGQSGTPAATFGPAESAIVEVSVDGTNWVSLGDVTFDVPTNGYTDLADPFASAPGNTPSDFQQPFTGSLSSFSGLRYSDASGPDMLELFAGSGGGKWLDISATGLAQVGFIRLSVANDLSDASRLNVEIDAVSIAHAAMGTPVVPEPATVVVACFALAVAAVTCRPAHWLCCAQAGTRRSRAK
jgi:hypothetical protein